MTEFSKINQILQAAARKNQNFKAELKKNPKQALEKFAKESNMLSKEELDTLQKADVRIVLRKASEIVLVLPADFFDNAALSEEELKRVSGGHHPCGLANVCISER